MQVPEADLLKFKTLLKGLVEQVSISRPSVFRLFYNDQGPNSQSSHKSLELLHVAAHLSDAWSDIKESEIGKPY